MEVPAVSEKVAAIVPAQMKPLENDFDCDKWIEQQHKEIAQICDEKIVEGNKVITEDIPPSMWYHKYLHNICDFNLLLILII